MVMLPTCPEYKPQIGIVCGGIWVSQANFPPGSEFFTSSGTFVVPTFVQSVRVLAIGGGGGGEGGDFSGGGGGYVQCGTFNITSVKSVAVIVGAGGDGGGWSGGMAYNHTDSQWRRVNFLFGGGLNI